MNQDDFAIDGQCPLLGCAAYMKCETCVIYKFCSARIAEFSEDKWRQSYGLPNKEVNDDIETSNR